MECFDIVPRIAQMLQGTSQPGCSHIRLGSENPQSGTGIPSRVPAAELNLSPLLKAMPVEPVYCYPCISPPQVITIWLSDSGEDMVTALASAEE